MQRFIAFCLEFIAGSKEISTFWKSIWAVVLVVLPLLGYSSSQVMEEVEKHLQKKWATLLFLLPPVIWLSARAGVAAERVAGPCIDARIGGYRNGTFHLQLQNTGSGTVHCQAYLDQVTDKAGFKGDAVVSPAEMFLEDSRLFGKKKALVPIFTMRTPKLNDHQFFITTCIRDKDTGEKRQGEFLLSFPTAENGIYIRIRIVFCQDDDRKAELMDKVLDLMVEPSDGIMGYEVQIKRFWTRWKNKTRRTYQVTPVPVNQKPTA